MPFAFAVSAKLKQMAFALAPASLTEKSQFLRPITFGRIAFSAGLLSISKWPSSRKAFNPAARLNVYSAAFASPAHFYQRKVSDQSKPKIHTQWASILVASLVAVLLVKDVLFYARYEIIDHSN